MMYAKKLVKKVDVKMQGNNKDVGFLSDAIFFIQNAIAAEHHALLSYATTKDGMWISLAKMIRENRSKLLYQMVANSNGQAYCFSKHIAACAMATKELGNRFLEVGNLQMAKECFEESANYEAMFTLVSQLPLKKLGGLSMTADKAKVD